MDLELTDFLFLFIFFISVCLFTLLSWIKHRHTKWLHVIITGNLQFSLSEDNEPFVSIVFTLIFRCVFKVTRCVDNQYPQWFWKHTIPTTLFTIKPSIRPFVLVVRFTAIRSVGPYVGVPNMVLADLLTFPVWTARAFSVSWPRLTSPSLDLRFPRHLAWRNKWLLPFIMSFYWWLKAGILMRC